MQEKNFKPFISPEQNIKELTVKSILLGALFGVIFGAATVYLALKAGLTVSASIPIAVIAITLGRRFFKTTILENNIIQTTGSAGESIAAGVAFTLPGFLFLSSPDSSSYFNYLTILILAIVGGLLGTLLMIPLRRSLIVNEHGNLPYPEGTACGDVCCGAVTARVIATEDEVIWRDFAASYPDHQSGAWVHDTDAFADWKAIHFDPATYSSAIEQRPPAVAQFPVASSGRVMQSIRRRLRHRVR